jgi:hypothetical protein
VTPKSAAWYLAAVMVLLATLMGFHITSLWVGVSICREYAEAAIDPNITLQGAEGVGEECKTVQDELNAVVDKYLAVFLSLIGGAAASGGYAATQPAAPPVRPPPPLVLTPGQRKPDDPADDV